MKSLYTFSLYGTGINILFFLFVICIDLTIYSQQKPIINLEEVLQTNEINLSKRTMYELVIKANKALNSQIEYRKALYLAIILFSFINIFIYGYIFKIQKKELDKEMNVRAGKGSVP